MKKRFTYSWKKRYTGQRILIILTGLLFSLHLLQATDNSGFFWQDAKVITGSVTDGNTKEPLPGVSILIQGTSKGTITDIDGKYTIEASEADILIFSYVGYLEEQVKVGTQAEINISLEPDIVGLDEIVVVGYGVQKKKLVTGATVQVKGEDIIKNNVTRLESSLQGLTPGMLIVKQSGQPGSDYNITIRGLGSVNGSSPLVLIDGVPGNLNSLNPSDVQSVDILKDAASAAIYGSRAADGVILITTKKGSAGKMQVSYDFYYGVSNVAKKMDVLNAKEYATIMNEQYLNIFTRTPDKKPFTQEFIDGLGEGTNWQDEVFVKNAPIQSHYLGLSGGNDVSTYSVSLSYNKENGILDYEDKSEYERMGFRVNSEHKVKKYLKIGENLTYTHRYKTGLGVGAYNNSFMRTVLTASPLISPLDPSVYDGFGRESYYDLEQTNPLADLHYKNNAKNRNDDIVGDIYAELEIIPGLKMRSDFGGNLSFANNSSFTDTFNITPNNYNVIPDFNEYMSRYFGYNWDNYITFEKTFGKHNILAMVGGNMQDNWYFKMNTDAEAFLANPNLEPVITNIALRSDLSDTVKVSGDFGKGDYRYSGFGRLSYNYDEKYLFTYSFRRDVSSRFGPNNRVGKFQAFSAGWVLSNEDFLKNNPLVSFLKLRTSWGQNGKEPYIQYAYLATVGNTGRQYPIGGGFQTGISPDIMANPNLSWEKGTQFDFGFDSRLLNAITFNADYYKKTSKDWIVPVTVPSISGSRGISDLRPLANGGNVINQGIEVELGYFKKIGDLNININGNFSYNKNKVLDVPGGVIEGQASTLYNSSERFARVEEGYPIGYFYGYQTNGIFQTKAQIDADTNSKGIRYQNSAVPGDVIRVNTNGDSVLSDDDKVMLGNPTPDFIYGLNISIGYKGFDFSMNLQGAAGHQIVKCYRGEERAVFNYTTDYLDRWQWIDKNQNGEIDMGEGTSNTMPRVTGGFDRNTNWQKFSDLYVEDADYLKIKSINIGYDFKSIMKNIPIEQFRVYVSATNLLTITKYTGFDPEVGYGSSYDSQGNLQDAFVSGVDVGFYPSARTYLVGLNVKF